MRHTVTFVALLVVFACKSETAPPSPTAAPTAPAPATPTPPPAPPTPPPTPVKLSAEELKPTCAKIFTAELAAKTHGATEVKDGDAKTDRLAICELHKGGEVVGSATIACNPDLDPTGIERERAAMTKAKDLPAPIGRGGYRISNNVFFNDDETPCRIMVNWMTMPADDVLADALRAIAAGVNPATLK